MEKATISEHNVLAVGLDPAVAGVVINRQFPTVSISRDAFDGKGIFFQQTEGVTTVHSGVVTLRRVIKIVGGPFAYIPHPGKYPSTYRKNR